MTRAARFRSFAQAHDPETRNGASPLRERGQTVRRVRPRVGSVLQKSTCTARSREAWALALPKGARRLRGRRPSNSRQLPGDRAPRASEAKARWANERRRPDPGGKVGRSVMGSAGASRAQPLRRWKALRVVNAAWSSRTRGRSGLGDLDTVGRRMRAGRYDEKRQEGQRLCSRDRGHAVEQSTWA